MNRGLPVVVSAMGGTLARICLCRTDAALFLVAVFPISFQSIERSFPNALKASGPCKLFLQEIIENLRICLAFGFFHRLADKEAQNLGFP
jgi:hypothetical protein